MAIGVPRFVPNPGAIERIGRLPELGKELQSITERAADIARSIAPVDEGTYRDSIDVLIGIDNGTVVAVLHADAPHGAFVEFGTSDTPAFAPLRRGVESAGLK